jgi:hypothetical protein
MQRHAVAQMIESRPMPAVHGVVRWRLIDLAQWIFEEFRITIAKQTLSRELRAMGYRKLSARPRHHAQAEGVIADFKKLPHAPGHNRVREGSPSRWGSPTNSLRDDLRQSRPTFRGRERLLNQAPNCLGARGIIRLLLGPILDPRFKRPRQSDRGYWILTCWRASTLFLYYGN